MKKIWNKNITWGGYAKFCGICTLIGMTISTIEVVIFRKHLGM